MREQIWELIEQKKIIAIIRGVPSGEMVKTVQALVDGGVRLVEITFDHSGKEGRAETLRSLRLVREKLGPEVNLGAGTVLTPRDVEDAKEAGADYIISPNVSQAVIERTRELDLLSMPGAFTPSEVVSAYEYGADIVKLFPAALMGIPYIKALLAPLSHIPVSAVGGVTPDSVEEYLKAGVCCFGIGSNLVNTERVARGEFSKIKEAASLYTQAVERCQSL